MPPDAEQPAVLHALTRKRAELAGRITEQQANLRRMSLDLVHLDATIGVFDPSIRVALIKSKTPQHVSYRGDIVRIVFDILRVATVPTTSSDITARLMIERGLDPSDRDVRDIMVKRVCACLRDREKRGELRRVDLPGRVQGWEAVR